jgi:hypothetical protein
MPTVTGRDAEHLRVCDAVDLSTGAELFTPSSLRHVVSVKFGATLIADDVTQDEVLGRVV